MIDEVQILIGVVIVSMIGALYYSALADWHEGRGDFDDAMFYSRFAVVAVVIMGVSIWMLFERWV